ncbi:MAG: hypothetical protein KDC76_10810 [Bacteroidetes bacterium]|nr:hypothetical protein [Bacteroidota bacterium]
MKKVFSLVLSVTLLSSISAIFLSGCGTSCTQTRTYVTMIEVFAPLSDVRNSFAVSNPTDLVEPGKIHVNGNRLYIVDVRKGIHIYDNSNPSNPVALKFISLQTCTDVFTRGNYLYANQGPDLVTLDVSDVSNIQLVDRLNNIIFSNLVKGDSFVVSYKEGEVIDVVEDCSGGSTFFFENDVVFSGSSGRSGTGISGSQSRLAILNNLLLAVDQSSVSSFSLDNPAKPTKLGSQVIQDGLETIFVQENAVFVGGENGMLIMSFQNGSLKTESFFFHSRGCDPVVVDNDLAFVTVRGSSPCGPAMNELHVIDVSNLSSPQLIVSHEMEDPHGLATRDSLLLICDGEAGMKIFNKNNIITIPQHLLSVQKAQSAFDVIVLGNQAILSATEGIIQFDITDPANPVKLSTILKKM